VLWLLLAVGLVLAALVALALALLRTWRVTRSLVCELGRASEAVATASAGLEPPPGVATRRGPPSAPAPASADGRALAARLGRA
jgi:hypothetical protein